MESEDNKKKVIVSVVVVVVIALLGLGASALTGKKKEDAAASTATNTAVTQVDATSPTTADSTTTTVSTASYKDGTYSASSTYRSPGGNEKITVKIIVKDGVVTTSDVDQEANNNDSEEYQSEFKDNYQSSVVGKKLSDIKLSHVSGSSLTSEGFNSALESIKTQATA